MTEAEIITDVLPDDGDGMPVPVAQSVLTWGFSQQAKQRFLSLLERNNRGELSDPDLAELDRFRRVGMLVDLVQARARQALHRHQNAG
jgi:hypothetical protein